MKSMQKNQTGFTLIELIVVIVILGILAATALPKFIDLGSDARAGVMKGVEGAMRGANSMIYAKAAAQGKAYTATDTVTIITGTTVATVFGYASTALTLQPQLTLSPATDFTVVATSITHANAKTPANCRITYGPAGSAGAEPTYTTDVSGC